MKTGLLAIAVVLAFAAPAIAGEGGFGCGFSYKGSVAYEGKPKVELKAEVKKDGKISQKEMVASVPKK